MPRRRRAALACALALGTGAGLAPPADAGLARAPTGTLDPTFGTGGAIVTDIGADSPIGYDRPVVVDLGRVEAPTAIARAPRGRVVVAGAAPEPTSTSSDTFVARFR